MPDDKHSIDKSPLLFTNEKLYIIHNCYNDYQALLAKIIRKKEFNCYVTTLQPLLIRCRKDLIAKCDCGSGGERHYLTLYLHRIMPIL